MAVGLVAKVINTASELYGQAKARYDASHTMRKAGQQAGQAASRMTDRARDLSGKAASGPMADKIRDLTARAAAALKDDQGRRPQHR